MTIKISFPDFASSMEQYEEAEQTSATAAEEPVQTKDKSGESTADFAGMKSAFEPGAKASTSEPFQPTSDENPAIPGHMTLHSMTPPPQSGSSTPVHKEASDSQTKTERKTAKNKMTPEQRAKMAALEEEKERAREARIKDLVRELITYIRPFVDAKHPGEAADPETAAFEKKTRLEAEDLKLESFGVELLHTIGNVYMTKSTNFMRSKKFFGGGFLGRLKEKGSMLKEGWGLLGSA